jgi:hypothetical protein
MSIKGGRRRRRTLNWWLWLTVGLLTVAIVAASVAARF